MDGAFDDGHLSPSRATWKSADDRVRELHGGDELLDDGTQGLLRVGACEDLAVVQRLA